MKKSNFSGAVKRRRITALLALKATIERGYKYDKNNVRTVLSESDKIRIKSEIAILESKI